MKSKKTKQTPNPEIELSFRKQNQQMDVQENRLNDEILRVHTIEKQRAMSEIWHYNQRELCEFFTTYETFPNKVVCLKELLDASNLKLIKNEGKIYFGQIYKKVREGKGISVNQEGKLYEGQFRDNEKHGRGVEIYPNGNLYMGQFLNNKKHATGTFFWFNLSSADQRDGIVEYYEGVWWGGLPDGQGTHQKVNGDIYAGHFKNGLKHGEGIEYYGNGDNYKGLYVNGLPEGFGEYHWSDGSLFKGDFKQGLRNGYGVWHLNDHTKEMYKGHYCMDKKSGYGVYHWENGWVYKGQFDNDFRNGFGELYEGNDLTYRGYWDNGQQTNRETTPTKSSTFRKSSQHFGRTIEKEDMETRSRQTINHPKADYNDFLSSRPSFIISQRPQSYSAVNQKERSQRNLLTKRKDKSKNSQTTTAVGSIINMPVMRSNNLYVPQLHSIRKR